MSVRAIAIELYKAQQKVHGLEEELQNSSLKDKDKIKNELRIARAELKVIRSLLDGEKAETPKMANSASFGIRY